MKKNYGMKPLAYALSAALLGLMSACGGGGGSAGSPPPAGTTPPPVAPPVAQYTVGGSVEGLGPGSAVTLSNGSETLTVGANGPFSFAAKFDTGAAFSIGAVAPEGYTCRVSDAAGTITGANAAKSVVACAPVVLAGVKSALQDPVAVTGDGTGSLYVLDNGPNTILKLGAGDGVEVLAGAGKPGNAEGTGGAARFWFGRGDLAFDTQGNLIVADGCNGAIRKVTVKGVVSTLAGKGTSSCNSFLSYDARHAVDGTGASAGFQHPQELVPDSAGGVIVVDEFNNTSVRMVSAAGEVSKRSWADPAPYGRVATTFKTIARDGDGKLYFSDDMHRIWKDVGGTLVLLAGGPSIGASLDGTGAGARFRLIRDMVAAPNGDLYVADATAVRKVTPAGVVTTLAGGPTAGALDATGSAARFVNIVSIGLDGANLAVIDNGAVRRVGLDGVVATLPSTPIVHGSTDGSGAAARFSSFSGLGADADGNLYVADVGTHLLRKVTSAGLVTTVGGKARTPGTTDGPLASALFAFPHAVATGKNGVIWVAQEQGLRKIQDGNVTTLLPDLFPFDLTVDADGNAVVSDGMNLLRVTPAGATTTLVDRDRVVALLGNSGIDFTPAAPVFDAAGNLYVADPATAVVYKLSTAGQLSVFAGTPLKNGDADGPVNTATLHFGDTTFMTVDGKGNLYLSSRGVVRMISPAGVVSSPGFGWGKATVRAVAYAKGKLYGMTKYALLQTWLP
ncbi:hypothetical protein [Massilia sp. Leaf139]|uniref:hypothetical protein n=1 Tax=Massilia sp. Leaf139 TaxID=1736272 RepID=UPI0006F6A0D2|nr:hypothetical protein [Massilia sp. Leaf139]KQQ89209.1 hypothetical protein ASF77_11120 [Massilia sp. Leaf139]